VLEGRCLRLLPRLSRLGPLRHLPRPDAVAQGRPRPVPLRSCWGISCFIPACQRRRSVFLMDWGLTIVAIGGIRVAALGCWWNVNCPAGSLQGDTPALIVGAKRFGRGLLRAIPAKPAARLTAWWGSSPRTGEAVGHDTLTGVPVIGQLADTCEPGSQAPHFGRLHHGRAGVESGQQVRQLVDLAREAQINVRVLPSYEQLLRRDGGTWRPREVSDRRTCCARPRRVRLNMAELHLWIDDRDTAGSPRSAGSIGSEICRQLLQFSPRRPGAGRPFGKRPASSGA